jgi:hypothetical protein
MHAWMSMGNPGANTKGLGSRNMLFPWKLQTSALQISNLKIISDLKFQISDYSDLKSQRPCRRHPEVAV